MNDMNTNLGSPVSEANPAADAWQVGPDGLKAQAGSRENPNNVVPYGQSVDSEARPGSWENPHVVPHKRPVDPNARPGSRTNPVISGPNSQAGLAAATRR